ncbi:MAG: hypothetical protein ACFB22_08515 [Rhodothalassiaceae bacterium]
MPMDRFPGPVPLILQATRLTWRHAEILLLLAVLLGIILYVSLLGRLDELAALMNQLQTQASEMEQSGQGDPAEAERLGRLVVQLLDQLRVTTALSFMLNPILLLVWTRAVAVGRGDVFAGGTRATLRRYALFLWRSVCMVFVTILFVLLAGVVVLVVQGLFGLILSLVGARQVAEFLASLAGLLVVSVALAGYYLSLCATAVDRGHGIFVGIGKAVETFRPYLIAIILLTLGSNIVASVIGAAFGAMPAGGAAVFVLVSIAVTGISLAAASITHEHDVRTDPLAGERF